MSIYFNFGSSLLLLPLFFPFFAEERKKFPSLRNITDCDEINFLSRRTKSFFFFSVQVGAESEEESETFHLKIEKLLEINLELSRSLAAQFSTCELSIFQGFANELKVIVFEGALQEILVRWS